MKWLTDAALLVRAIALALATLAGALLERDIGVLPVAAPVAHGQPSVSSSK